MFTGNFDPGEEVPLVDLLTGPHGVDRYTELVDPAWTIGDARCEGGRGTPRDTTQRDSPAPAQRRGRWPSGWTGPIRAGPAPEPDR